MKIRYGEGRSRGGRFGGAFCALLALVLLAGCVGPATVQHEDADPRLRVAATTTHIADLASRIGGERVIVTGLMGPGVDPHLYRASEGDLDVLLGADLVLHHGLMLEGKLGDVLSRLGERKPVRAVTDGIPGDLLKADPAAPEHPDPHVWFDPTLWAHAADAVGAALAEADPAHAAEYRASAEALRAELQELDEWAAAELSAIPEGQRVLVTAHDAFGYFGDRYGMQVLGLQGISTESEAGLADIDRLADVIVDARVPAVFVETSVSPRTVEAVMEAVRARGASVELGGSLYSDALGEPGTPAATYPGMFRENVLTITEALT